MEVWKKKLKYIVEHTDLFVEIRGHKPNIVSDFGRAISIDLNKEIVKFSRHATTKRQLGSELAWGQDIFLRTEIPLAITSFSINKTFSIEDASWQKYRMDELKLSQHGNSWNCLYDHIRNLEINKNFITRLKHRLSPTDKYLKSLSYES